MTLRDLVHGLQNYLAEATESAWNSWNFASVLNKVQVIQGNENPVEIPKGAPGHPGEKPALKPGEKPKFEKWTSSGGVVLFGVTEEGLKKVLLVAPKGKYGGYAWTFPKGRVDEGENLVKTAKREVREESGIEASLLPGGYLGSAEGTSSVTHYYMMVRVGGEPGVGTDGETEKVEWVTWPEAFNRIRGSSRDKKILLRAWDYTRKMRKKLT